MSREEWGAGGDVVSQCSLFGAPDLSSFLRYKSHWETTPPQCPKRSVVGSFHQISANHVASYLDEFEWRFNGRKNPYLFRDTLTRLLNAPKMEFKELITKSA
jgi:hypothetical protein